ncbi:Fe-Mn family superoxide dismutase [Candidatus Kinetoplastibacterium blastocrithidii TCC012E]|uniref:Superoxide dismutase n=2 Tax=cellular organisms TaxID=131567 RepID=S9U1E1_9TRYP|nr:Fe-Mn family superoxide dismutase [Candidatus Kinetoplastibacterium blastocrithidii]EPY20367.1 superoxide dismutase, Fe-Mn family [Strigomonas culicis]AGF49721.1 Fe-Mn family superoxide dismutase [Candidatus Kinetoplastibacterium blastocrithidii TCC012E]EPY22649.1 superoxide dismutase, Fe-Mn family [Strigomonas culicis]EPY28372.1 superoxide dismutase, Fe-Mn family [Strigomonas culicis]EPY31732.1 superoxide dismutase, Fe-Mn family [Strigomonas culicis]|eukprot:EPY20367.1 superoxide dismutase, Fe-Mn family [Strigomonas culicis]
MSYNLPPLPYDASSLSPYISKETIEFHYGKHHKTYVDNLNNLISDNELSKLNLDDIIKNSTGAIFNNAAQIWNHNFYWNSLSPIFNQHPSDILLKSIELKWGNFENFKESFTRSALSNFGSGWTWLVKKTDGSLDIVNTSNANTPIITEDKALLTCDVWEHAYYIDYRNSRAKYLENFWEIINWNFVSSNFSG